MSHVMLFAIPSKIDELLASREIVFDYLREVGQCAAMSILQDAVFRQGVQMLDPTSDFFLTNVDDRATCALNLMSLIDGYVERTIRSN